jgi:shikimate dehydrogenase
MYPNKDTIMCISLAGRPSNFGMTVHNAAYRALDLNYLYKAMSTDDLPAALAGVRALGIRGCSVSMPFKEAAVGLVDHLDSAAAAIGAINTIVNNRGKLVGYNTDAFGARGVLTQLNLPRHSRILLLGAGGVARAISWAIKSLEYPDVVIANRSADRPTTWPDALQFPTIPWAERNRYDAQLIINTTSIGMAPEVDAMPIGDEAIQRATAVMDVVVTPLETRFIRTAQGFGRTVIRGYEMSLQQAMRQFELYTGQPAPRAQMEDSLRRLLAPTGV